MASGESEQDLLKDIAEQIAKNQMSFDSKSEEEKRKLLGTVDIIASSQLRELQKEFNTLMGGIEGEIPENARIKILEGINDRVSSEKLKTLEGIFSSKDVQVLASTIVTEIVANNTEKDDDAKVIPLMDERNSEEIENDEQDKLTKELSDKYDGYFTDSENIAEEKANIQRVMKKLDKEEQERTLNRANNGDPDAIVEIMVEMAAMSFTKTNISIEEMIEIDKIKAIEALDKLIVAYDMLGSKNIFILAEELSEKWGIDVVTQDENGNMILDRFKIVEYAREHDIQYQSTKKESLIEDVDRYENLADIDDLERETEIENAVCTMNRNISVIMEEIQAGKNPSELEPVLRKTLSQDFDAALRTVENWGRDWNSYFSNHSIADETQMKLFILKEGIRIYGDAKAGKNNGVIDKFTDDTFCGIMKQSVDFMKRCGIQDKELLDLMLSVAPQEAQEILNDKDFFNYFASRDSKTAPTTLEERPKKNIQDTRVKNLFSTLAKRINVKGIAETLHFVTNEIKTNKRVEDRNVFMNATLELLKGRENSYEETERLARKSFFSTIITEKVYDEKALKEMIEIDSTTIKEMLDELIERQNSLDENTNNINAIMDIGRHMKESRGNKVLSSESVRIEDVVGIVSDETQKTEISQTEHYDDDDVR